MPLDSVDHYVIKPGNHLLLLYSPETIMLLIALAASNDEIRHVENPTECMPLRPHKTNSAGHGDTIEKSGK